MSQNLLKAIRGNPNYKQFLTIIEVVRGRIDIEAATKEASALHAGRLSRSLHGEHRYSPKHIVDANMQDLSNRARLVELRVRHDKQLSNLKAAVDAMRGHILTEYSDELGDFSTADQRKSFANRVMKSSVQLQSDLEALISILDHLIKDLDQASHTMRNIVALLQMISERGRTV